VKELLCDSEQALTWHITPLAEEPSVSVSSTLSVYLPSPVSRWPRTILSSTGTFHVPKHTDGGENCSPRPIMQGVPVIIEWHSGNY